MTRKEWLEKFIELVETGASTLNFRRHCRIKAQHLPRHMRQLDAFRSELLILQAKEDEAKHAEKIRQARLDSLERARAARAAQAEDRLAALKAAQEAGQTNDDGKETSDSE